MKIDELVWKASFTKNKKKRKKNRRAHGYIKHEIRSDIIAGISFGKKEGREKRRGPIIKFGRECLPGVSNGGSLGVGRDFPLGHGGNVSVDQYKIFACPFVRVWRYSDRIREPKHRRGRSIYRADLERARWERKERVRLYMRLSF